jgi:hypothetical protein
MPVAAKALRFLPSKLVQIYGTRLWGLQPCSIQQILAVPRLSTAGTYMCCFIRH